MSPTSCVVAWLLVALPNADTPSSPAPLPPEAKQVLDDMVKDFLFDPRDAQRVRVTVPVRSVGSMVPTVREGWLVAAKGDNPARVFFTDGDSILAPPDKAMKRLDFIAYCRREYAPNRERTNDAGALSELLRPWFPREAQPDRPEPSLVEAAWLHRLGEDELAARALLDACKRPDALGTLRKDLARQAFEELVGAFNARADDEALRHGDRLLRQYPVEAQALPFGQRIVDDLRCRQKAGTFAKKLVKDWPRGFDAWDAPKKAAFLIAALEEVDGEVNSWGYHRVNGMVGDRPIKALLAVGEAAVPDLIDAVEKDERLTRRVNVLDGPHFGLDRDERTEKYKVVTVRRAALGALLAILRLDNFTAATDRNLLANGAEGARAAAAELRAYWKKYGGLAFDERMVKMLGDPLLPFDLTREAARNLTAQARVRAERDAGQPSAVPPFDARTVEALLDAMDRDLEDHDASTVRRSRAYIEDIYLAALVDRGNRGVAGLLGVRGLTAQDPGMRRKWSFAALQLGDNRPWQTYCEEMRTGKLDLPDRELFAALRCLVKARTPASERALVALAAPEHRHAKAIREYMTEQWEMRGVELVRHPFVLLILRDELNNPADAGSSWKVEGGWLRHRGTQFIRTESLDDFLQDPAVRFDEAQERVCDLAGRRLSDLVFGMPQSHPLLLDRDHILNAMRTWFVRFPAPYRALSEAECAALGLPQREPPFVLDVRPLGRPATAADVTAGRALFHLDGKSKVSDLKLPATALLKRDQKDKNSERVLIVQAETANGVTKYGVFARHAVLVVTAEEVSDIKPVAEKP